MSKKALLQKPVQHIDITKVVTVMDFIHAARGMSFVAGEVANAANIYNTMLQDKDCTIVLALAGSTSAAGCMDVYTEMVKLGMVDVVVATGASIIDMDFFEALGFRHYLGSAEADDIALRAQYIDRIYSVFIDEEELQNCDQAVAEIARSLEPRPYSSREFIHEMGRWLVNNPERALKENSLVQVAYEKGVPIFCPAFSDSSAGLGLAHYQKQCISNGEKYLSIDSVADFRELTDLKIACRETGLFMIGGGTPKNFIQDTVVGAEVFGKDVPMHKYAIQITTADVRDGGCSSSTLSEARSWGKVDTSSTQMVYAEASLVVPLLAIELFQRGNWRERGKKSFTF